MNTFRSFSPMHGIFQRPSTAIANRVDPVPVAVPSKVSAAFLLRNSFSRRVLLRVGPSKNSATVLLRDSVSRRMPVQSILFLSPVSQWMYDDDAPPPVWKSVAMIPAIQVNSDTYRYFFRNYLRKSGLILLVTRIHITTLPPFVSRIEFLNFVRSIFFSGIRGRGNF